MLKGCSCFAPESYRHPAPCKSAEYWDEPSLICPVWFLCCPVSFRVCLRKGNREFKANKQVIKDGSPGGERALKRCSEGPMLSNYMLIFKTTTTETIGAKVWKCMLEGIFLGNASLLCSYLCLEPCIWTDSIWIKIQLLYSCDDRGRDRYYSQGRQKAFWNIERFYYWSVGSQIDILWLLSTPGMTVHPSEGWYTKSMNQTNKTEPHLRSPPQRRRGCLLETLKKKKEHLLMIVVEVRHSLLF